MKGAHQILDDAWKAQRKKNVTTTAKSNNECDQSPKDYLERNVRTKVRKTKIDARITRSSSQARSSVLSGEIDGKKAETKPANPLILEVQEQSLVDESQSYIECEDESQGACSSIDTSKGPEEKSTPSRQSAVAAANRVSTENVLSGMLQAGNTLLAIEGTPAPTTPKASQPRLPSSPVHKQKVQNILKKQRDPWQRTELYKRAQDAKNTLERGLAVGLLLIPAARREEFQGALEIIEATLLEFELRYQQSEILLNMEAMASGTRNTTPSEETSRKGSTKHSEHTPNAAWQNSSTPKAKENKTNKTFAEATRTATSTVVVDCDTNNPEKVDKLNNILVGSLANRIKIKNAKQIEGKGWVLKCESSNQASMLKKELEQPDGTNDANQDPQFKVHIGRPKRSNISIRGVPKGLKEELIFSQVLDFNEVDEIKARESGVKGPVLDRRFQTSRGSEVWIVSLPESLARAVIAKSPVQIGLSTCTIEPYFKIRRCYRCQRYGHVARSCTNEQICAECGDSHEGPCTNQEQGCENCNLFDTLNHCVTVLAHPAYSTSCPCYRGLVEWSKTKGRELSQNEIRSFFMNQSEEYLGHDQRKPDGNKVSERYKVPERYRTKNFKNRGPSTPPQDPYDWQEVSYKKPRVRFHSQKDMYSQNNYSQRYPFVNRKRI